MILFILLYSRVGKIQDFDHVCFNLRLFSTMPSPSSRDIRTYFSI